jgi:hypothetical protein
MLHAFRPILPVLCAFAALSPCLAEDKDLTADQLPPAVLATMQQAAHGQPLSNFEQETRNGAIQYTAEIPATEKTVTEFAVAPDGTLISQKTEEKDADEKDGDKGK